MFDDKHPLAVLELPRNMTYVLDYYSPVPRFDEEDGEYPPDTTRKTELIPGKKLFDKDTMSEYVEDLEDGEELGLRNIVVNSRGQTVRIPMIDFATSVPPEVFKEAIKKASVDLEILKHFKFFSSGESYHGYCDIITHMGTAWHIFLGELLLLNRKGEPPFIDSRWVGHSLRKDASVLRLTNRVKPQMPTAI